MRKMKFFSCILLMVILVSSISPVYAEVSYSIDMKQVQEDWEKADEVPVVKDKEVEGSNGVTPLAMGTYPTRKGVILVTPDKLKGIIPTGHAAIVYTSTTVVESLSGGVTTGTNNWNKTRSKCYGVTVSGTTTTQDSNAANWCYNQRGKSYNWNYLNVSTRKSFYCSHLVWAAFKDLYGIDLNTSSYGVAVHPMELVNTSRTYKIYES
jgi:uncharacterized protein YycO